MTASDEESLSGCVHQERTVARRSAAPKVTRKESRFHQVLEKVVANFAPSRQLAPFKVPDHPVDLVGVLPAYFDPDAVETEDLAFLRYSDHTTLLDLEWSGGPGSCSSWSLRALTLPSRRRIYVVIGEEQHHVIAATAPTFRPEIEDRTLLGLLATSNGFAFGTGVIGSLPSHVVTEIHDEELLVEVFRDLLSAAEAWDSLDDAWGHLWTTPPFEDLPEAQQVTLEAEFDRDHPRPCGTWAGVVFDSWLEERLAPPPEERVRRWLREVRR